MNEVASVIWQGLDGVVVVPPVLYLVPPGMAPPEDLDPLVDWVMLSADEEEKDSRRKRLEQRSQLGEKVRIDDGLLICRGGSVSLSPLETLIMESLISRRGLVVHRDQLLRHAWPSSSDRDRGRLDAAIRRLRKRILEVGLLISTVRGRGYVLDETTPVVVR